MAPNRHPVRLQDSNGYVKKVVDLVPRIRQLSLGTRNSNVLKVITVIINENK